MCVRFSAYICLLIASKFDMWLLTSLLLLLKNNFICFDKCFWCLLEILFRHEADVLRSEEGAALFFFAHFVLYLLFKAPIFLVVPQSLEV